MKFIKTIFLVLLSPTLLLAMDQASSSTSEVKKVTESLATISLEEKMGESSATNHRPKPNKTLLDIPEEQQSRERSKNPIFNNKVTRRTLRISMKNNDFASAKLCALFDYSAPITYDENGVMVPPKRLNAYNLKINKLIKAAKAGYKAEIARKLNTDQQPQNSARRQLFSTEDTIDRKFNAALQPDNQP